MESTDTAPTASTTETATAVTAALTINQRRTNYEILGTTFEL